MNEQSRKWRPARDRREPVDPDLRPTHSALGKDAVSGAKLMVRLRELHNAVADAYTARDTFIYELATSRDLSRRDMATACGMNKSRIDQIIEQMDQKKDAPDS
jgi:hypothetical protein